MEKYPVTIGLHGFWGRPEDWQQVQDFFPHLFVAKDLYENLDWLQLPLGEAARQWGLYYQKRYPDGVILAGYSMGGRFALHVARLFPTWVKGMAMLSTHPGGLRADEAETRQKWIDDWQNKFRRLSPFGAMATWQQQETFVNTKFEPFRQDLSGEILALNLEKWSLMKHEVTLDTLDQVSLPQVWLFGKDDVKFQKVSKNLRARWPKKKVLDLPSAGHRLLLDAPEKVAETLKELVQLNLQKGVQHEASIH